MIDTHCHLTSSRFDKDRAEVLARARRAGVARVVEVGFDLASSGRALALAAAEPDLWAAVGVHPHEVAKAPRDARERLALLARAPQVVAIGEIGLDFYRNLSAPEVQRAWLADQLALAAEVGLPVVIHTRDAMGEMLDTLAARAPARRGILHCWSGDAAQAKRAVDLGFALGIGGTVTYGSTALEEAVRAVPREKKLWDCLASSPTSSVILGPCRCAIRFVYAG